MVFSITFSTRLKSNGFCSQIGFENGVIVMAEPPAGHDEFDFAAIESEEIRELVAERVEREVYARLAEVTSKLLGIVIYAANPRRAAYQMAYACGMGVLCGGSASSIAKKFGQSRQAFEQEGGRLLSSLDLRKNPLEKRNEARAIYSITNYRHDGRKKDE